MKILIEMHDFIIRRLLRDNVTNQYIDFEDKTTLSSVH